MTENKRFVVEKYSIRDMSVDTKYINSYYHIGDNGVAKRLCDLLNELTEENNQLKKRISGLESVNEHGVNFADKVWNVLLSMDKRDLLPIERIFFNNLCAEMGIDLK